MKRTFRWVQITLTLALGIFALTACSTDNPDDNGGKKQLPTFADLTVAVGGTGTIQFNAYDTWTLSSDKTWFKFSVETGKAGEQSVTYNVTDDGQGFNDDIATLTFAIGKNSATFKATRGAKERTIKFYKLNRETYAWEQTETLDLSYADNAKTYNLGYKVVANYNWKLTVPKWISIDGDYTSGQANADADMENDPASVTTSWIIVNYAEALTDDMSGKFVFADRTETDKAIEVTVTAPGAKNYMISKAAAAVTITPEGKYITKSFDPETDEEVITEHESYQFNVLAGTGNVNFYRVWKQDGYYGVDPTGMGGSFQYRANWCGVDPVTANNQNVGPNVKEFGYEVWCNPIGDAARVATIIAIPKAIDPGYKEQDFVASNEQDIKEEFLQYIVTEVTQELSKGISFAYPNYVYGISLNKMPEGNELNAIKSEYGTEVVYQMSYDSFESATYAGLKFVGFDVYNLNLEFVPASAELTASAGWIGFEMGETSMVNISDEFTAYTGPRSALLVFRENGVGAVVLKITQNCARE